MFKKFLRVGGVAAKLGIGVSSVWRLIHTEGNFPRPIKLSQRVTVWEETEIEAYMAEKAGRNEERHADAAEA